LLFSILLIATIFFLAIQRNCWVFFALLVIGFIIIAMNTLIIHEVNGQWFEGSDATYLYLRARLFADSPSIIFETDKRYIGYILFQFLTTYPFTKNEVVASFLIRFSNWLIWILTLIFLEKKFEEYFNFKLIKSIAFLVVANGALLWVSLYNFRDTIIVSLVTALCALIIGFKKKDIVFLVFLSFALWFFRYFFLYAFIGSLIISLAVLRERKFNAGFFRITFGIILSVLIILIFFPTQFWSNLAVNFNDFRFFVVGSLLSLGKLFRGIASSFLAGNPLKFSYTSFALGVDRAFVTTGLSSLLQGIVYLGTYFFLIPLYILLIFTNSYNLVAYDKNIKNKSKLVFMITVVILITFIISIYSLFFGGTQERIRVVVLVQAAILMEIFKRNSYARKYIPKALLTSSIIMFLFVVINPL